MLLPLASVLGLAVLWTIYWFVASSLVQERFDGQRAELAGQGLTLDCMGEGWGGFPFHFEFTCRRPVLRLPAGAQAASEDLLLVALAYAPWQIVALLDGATVVSAPGVTAATVKHQRIIATLTFDKDRKPRLSAEIPALRAEGLGSAAKLMFHTRPASTGGMDIALTANDAVYQPLGKAPLSLSTVDFLGRLTPDNSLEIERIAFEQGKVRYWGQGKLAVDPLHRPDGRVDTETNDLDGLLSMLEPHLQLAAEQKSGLRAMLGLLGNEAKAPLIAKDGVLYLGPFKIGDLVPLY
jgi:hypothetical protein